MAPSPAPAPDPRGHIIFEIVNRKRQEIYVASTRDPIFQLTETLHRHRPEAIKHWDPADMEPIRSIEFNMDERDARVFISNYVSTALPAGWRLLTN